MNRNKILSIAGTMVLAGIAAFAGRAAVKLVSNQATDLYYTKGGTCQHFSLTGGTYAGSARMTTGGAGTPAFLATGTTTVTKYAIFNTSNCTAASRIHLTGL